MGNNKEEMLKALERKKVEKKESFINNINSGGKINKKRKGNFEKKMHRRKSGSS